jgi:beta-lactamase regulating signal transducer with metallopeptidase domain
VSFFDVIVEHGPRLLLGSTLVLLVGCLLLRAQRAVADRRSTGILTVLGLVVYLVAGVVPLPRLQFEFDFAGAGAAPANVSSRFAPGERTAPSVPEAAPGLPIGEPVAADPPIARTTQPVARRLAVPASVPALLRDSRDEPVSGTDLAGGMSWARLFAAAWVTGAVAASAWLLVATLALHLLLAGSRPAPASLRTAAGLPPSVALRMVDRPVRPFCCGVWRQAIVLPQDLCTAEHAGKALAVLRHEAAHVRTGDSRLAAVFALLTPLLFFHPLFWWLRREVRFSSELLADDVAARAAGVHTYVRELLDLAERQGPRVCAAGAVSVFHRPSEFYRRIQMLLQRQGHLSTSITPARRLFQALSTMALVATAAGFFGSTPRAQEPEGPAASLRNENEVLRRTIVELRTEVQAMRRRVEELAEVPPRAVSAPPVGLPGLPPTAAIAPVSGTVAPPCAPDAPSATAPAAPVERELVYVVQKGDTLQSIARRCVTTPDRIARCNPDLDPARLRVGERIRVVTGDPMPAVTPPPGVLQEPTVAARDPRGRPVMLDSPDLQPVPEHDPLDHGAASVFVLTTQVVELSGAVELARAECEAAEEALANGVGDRRHAVAARIQLATAERKLAAAQKWVAIAQQDAEDELQALFGERSKSDGPERKQIERQIRRLERRLEALRDVAPAARSADGRTER